MKLKTVFAIAAIPMCLVGLGMTLAAATILGTVGLDANLASTHMARAAGGAFLGLAITTWLARNAGPFQAGNALVAGRSVMSESQLPVPRYDLPQLGETGLPQPMDVAGGVLLYHEMCGCGRYSNQTKIGAFPCAVESQHTDRWSICRITGLPVTMSSKSGAEWVQIGYSKHIQHVEGI
jgi:hypothetical protein